MFNNQYNQPAGQPIPMGGDQFILEKLEYMPAGHYNPMPVRPYTFQPTDQALNTITERMAQYKTGKVSTGVLTGVTSGILQPSAVAFESTVNQQWIQVPRFAFFMKVRRIDAVGIEECHYIFGYTDRDGVNMATGHTDQEMVFYVNNVVTTGAYTLQTPMGLQRQEKLMSHYNTIHATTGNNLYTQRPLDIFETLSVKQTAQWMGGNIIPQTATGQVGPYTNNTVSSAAENSIPAEYLSKILTSGMQVNAMKEIHMNSYNVEQDDRVSRYFAEESMMNNAFIRKINQMAGFMEPRPMFIFRDLMRFDPTIDGRARVWQLEELYRNPVYQNTPDVGEHWHGQDPDTVKAYPIIEASIGLATKLGFTKLSFKATNKASPTADIIVSIENWTSFLEVDEQSFYVLCEHFKQQFIDQIFLNESSMGRRPLFVEVHVDMLRASKIYIEYENSYGTWYTLPTFANSAFTSVLTNDANMVADAAIQLNNVIDQITPKSSIHSGNFTTYHPGF